MLEAIAPTLPVVIRVLVSMATQETARLAVVRVGLTISLFSMPSQCGATAERRTRDREIPGSQLACAIWIF